MNRRRTALFMPGSNPSFLVNGGNYGADSVIMDLEDAVTPSEKDAARILVRHALSEYSFSVPRLVRINDISTPYWKQDLDEIVQGAPDGIVLPKCETAQDVKTFDEYVTNLEKKYNLEVGKIEFMCLIETCLGVRNAYDIATASSRVESIALGAVDLTIDMGTELSDTGEEMVYSRSKLLIDARAAGVYIYDTSYPDVENIEGLIYWTNYSKKLGYDGRPVISPSHIDIVNAIFSPSEEDISHAIEVLAAAEEGKRLGKGSVTLHGKQVDVANIKRAEQVIDMAKRMGMYNEE